MSDLLDRILGHKKNLNAAMKEYEDPTPQAAPLHPAEIVKEFRGEQMSNPDLEFVQYMKRKRPNLNIFEIARQLDEYAKKTGNVSDSSFVPDRQELQYRVNNPPGGDW